MNTTKTVQLKLPQLPETAKTAHRLPGLTNNLLSVAVLCDAGCTVTFSADDVIVNKERAKVLEGWRDPINRLWRVPLTPTAHTPAKSRNRNYYNILQDNNPPQAANAMYDCATERQLVQFYHATCFSPTKSTWINAIKKGYFKGWPGLSADLVQRHLGVEVATEKGHLDQRRKTYD